MRFQQPEWLRMAAAAERTRRRGALLRRGEQGVSISPSGKVF